MNKNFILDILLSFFITFGIYNIPGCKHHNQQNNQDIEQLCDKEKNEKIKCKK